MSAKKRKPTSFNPSDTHTYIAFNKPHDVLSQFSEGEGSQQTLGDFGFPPRVYPIGRLDADSEGLIVLSDDGRLNTKLLDPENQHSRTYWVQVENIPEETALQKLRDGVIVQGRKTKRCLAVVLEEPDLPPRPVPIRFRKNIPTSWIALTLTEGRNRQVRRMTAAVGHPTLRLVRYAIGSFTLDTLGLPPGQWRKLNSEEVKSLFVV